jgi:hypothetical protein
MEAGNQRAASEVDKVYASIQYEPYKWINSVNMDPIRNPYAPGAGTQPRNWLVAPACLKMPE